MENEMKPAYEVLAEIDKAHEDKVQAIIVTTPMLEHAAHKALTQAMDEIRESEKARTMLARKRYYERKNANSQEMGQKEIENDEAYHAEVQAVELEKGKKADEAHDRYNERLKEIREAAHNRIRAANQKRRTEYALVNVDVLAQQEAEHKAKKKDKKD